MKIQYPTMSKSKGAVETGSLFHQTRFLKVTDPKTKPPVFASLLGIRSILEGFAPNKNPTTK